MATQINAFFDPTSRDVLRAVFLWRSLLQVCLPILPCIVKNIRLIVAGSLLGVAVSREEFSFPVGRVNRLTLLPMDFEEFLIAVGKSDFVARIKECFETDKPMDTIYHDSLFEYYRQYLVVGGMPDCVAKFKETGDYVLIRATQKLILNDYWTT